MVASLANIAEGGSGLGTHCKAILKCMVSYRIFEGCEGEAADNSGPFQEERPI